MLDLGTRPACLAYHIRTARTGDVAEWTLRLRAALQNGGTELPLSDWSSRSGQKAVGRRPEHILELGVELDYLRCSAAKHRSTLGWQYVAPGARKASLRTVNATDHHAQIA